MVRSSSSRRRSTRISFAADSDPPSSNSTTAGRATATAGRGPTARPRGAMARRPRGRARRLQIRRGPTTTCSARCRASWPHRTWRTWRTPGPRVARLSRETTKWPSPTPSGRTATANWTARCVALLTSSSRGPRLGLASTRRRLAGPLTTATRPSRRKSASTRSASASGAGRRRSATRTRPCRFHRTGPTRTSRCPLRWPPSAPRFATRPESRASASRRWTTLWKRSARP
mmetsp:Transcript_33865/g.118473  ORF Transcript_33865/g.118473 Transcript_33865/m.118473 type:complete len:230 (-) Transcript_33865:1236-1925(-)